MSITYAKIRTDAVIFNPISNLPVDNALYISTSLGNKLTSEAPSALGADFFIKKKQAGAFIRAGKEVSLRSDGYIVEAESDGVEAQQPIGISLADIDPDGIGDIFLVAPSAPGVLTGMGFLPGQEIFIGETTGGFVNDITPFTGNNDSLIQVGIADCAAGAASGTATDLILVRQVIARP